ncbi:MAG: CPBP family intramembrane glutamate endopeptidase, partial [Maribacter sp.]
MYIEQAHKGENELWRTVLTLLVSTGFLIANTIFILLLPDGELEKMYELMNSIPTNIGLVTNLIPFAILLGLLVLMVVFIHKRSFVSLTTSRKKIDFSRVFFSA